MGIARFQQNNRGTAAATMNLPNFISIARLLAVPLTVYLLLQGANVAAFWLFIAAGVSDAVDGFIAKKFDMATTLGAYLDPLADKALLVGVYVTLGYMGHLSMWLVILVVFRDILIVGGTMVLWMMTGRVGIKPLYVSKINTALQIALVGLVLANLGLVLPVTLPVEMFAYLVAVTTLLSGATYLVNWIKQLSEDGS